MIETIPMNIKVTKEQRIEKKEIQGATLIRFRFEDSSFSFRLKHWRFVTMIVLKVLSQSVAIDNNRRRETIAVPHVTIE